MNRPRLFRGIRIAWSVGCGVLCLLLIALWVRSYWWVEEIIGDISGERIVVGSSPGSFIIGFTKDRSAPLWTRMNMTAEQYLSSWRFPWDVRNSILPAARRIWHNGDFLLVMQQWGVAPCSVGHIIEEQCAVLATAAKAH